MIDLQKEIFLKEFDRLPNSLNSLNAVIDTSMLTISSVIIGLTYTNGGILSALTTICFLITICLILYNCHNSLIFMKNQYTHIRNDYTENKEIIINVDPKLYLDKHSKIMFCIGLIILSLDKFGIILKYLIC